VAAGDEAFELVRGALGDQLSVVRTAIRSASWSASSRYCVVRKMVTPSAARSRMICHMVRPLRGSRPVVGSSRKTMRGCPIRPIARSSRRRMPTE
jgi:hypothetical protein